MRMHRRQKIVHSAQVDLQKQIRDWLQRHDLTTIEELHLINYVLSNTIGGTLKYALREERHGDVNEPAGLASKKKGESLEWGPGAPNDAGE